jgi:hypothetical protein
MTWRDCGFVSRLLDKAESTNSLGGGRRCQSSRAERTEDGGQRAPVLRKPAKSIGSCQRTTPRFDWPMGCPCSVGATERQREVSRFRVLRRSRLAAYADQMPEKHPKSVDIKRARLEDKAQRAIQDGTEWLTATEIANLAALGPADPIGTVNRWKTQKHIFALRYGEDDFYPKYALGQDYRPLDAMKEILAVLEGYDPALLAGWFDSTSRFLGGKRPRELIANDAAKVLAAARHMIESREYHG